MNAAVEKYLRSLVAKVEDVPLLDEVTETEIGTPKATAAIARAALVWLLDGRPDAIERRLRDELADIDLYKRFAIAEASRDVAAAYVDLPPDSRRHVSFAERQRRRAEMLGMPVEELGNTDFDPKYAITGEMSFSELDRARRAAAKAKLPPELIQEAVNRFRATS